MSRNRKHYSPEEKVNILKKHLFEKVPVSDLCDQYGLHTTVFHRWLNPPAYVLFQNLTQIYIT